MVCLKHMQLAGRHSHPIEKEGSGAQFGRAIAAA